MKRIGLVIAFLCLGAPADAKLTKYHYLLWAGSVYAFKSKVACEEQKQRIVAAQRQISKKYGTKIDLKPRCTGTRPYGYQRPYPNDL